MCGHGAYWNRNRRAKAYRKKRGKENKKKQIADASSNIKNQ
jgi:hypothetical protein